MYRVEQALVPVDLSASSRSALGLAGGLGSREYPVGLHLSHVLEPWRPYMRSVLFPYAALGEDDVEFEEELLAEARRHLIAHLEVDPDSDDALSLSLQIGPVSDKLGERIRSVGPDLIVMGAFGEGGVLPNVLGSTAEKMLRTTSRPLVLVRHYDLVPTIEHIVVAVDLTSSSTDVVATALGLAMQIGATLEMVYVLPDPLAQDSNQILGRHLEFDAAAILKRSRAKIEALFDRMVDQIEVPFPQRQRADELLAHRKVVIGQPSAALIDHADAAGADLLVVGAHSPQSGSGRPLGGVAWTVARTNPTHTMVVPPHREVSLLDDDD